MDTMSYRGFKGTCVVAGSETFVRIDQITDDITSRISPGEDRSKIFRELVDNYIAACEGLGLNGRLVCRNAC
jgi:hypothetical protein